MSVFWFQNVSCHRQQFRRPRLNLVKTVMLFVLSIYLNCFFNLSINLHYACYEDYPQFLPRKWNDAFRLSSFDEQRTAGCCHACCFMYIF